MGIEIPPICKEFIAWLICGMNWERAIPIIMQMATHLGHVNLEKYMNTANVWQTQHMRVEEAIETELAR